VGKTTTVQGDTHRCIQTRNAINPFLSKQTPTHNINYWRGKASTGLSQKF